MLERKGEKMNVVSLADLITK